jgi:hypothetical protein
MGRPTLPTHCCDLYAHASALHPAICVTAAAWDRPAGAREKYVGAVVRKQKCRELADTVVRVLLDRESESRGRPTGWR